MLLGFLLFVFFLFFLSYTKKNPLATGSLTCTTKGGNGKKSMLVNQGHRDLAPETLPMFSNCGAPPDPGGKGQSRRDCFYLLLLGLEPRGRTLTLQLACPGPTAPSHSALWLKGLPTSSWR